MLDLHIAMIKSCDTMFMLDGWEKSEGAKAELAKALALGMEIVLQSNYKAPAEAVERAQYDRRRVNCEDEEDRGFML